MACEVPTRVPNPLPPWARPVHVLHTPRLTLRSALESDAPAFTKLFSEPNNNPFGGVRGHFKSEDEQRENLSKQAGSTARGENAWLVVVLKPSNPAPENTDVLKVDDGLLIGSTGFNEFKVRKDEEGKEILCTDVGCLIDWRFHRRGYALETLQAIFEYAFSELKAQKISAETNTENKPWRNLMDVMGIPIERIKTDSRDPGDRGGDSVAYRFTEKDWAVAREKLKASEKWLLNL